MHCCPVDVLFEVQKYRKVFYKRLQTENVTSKTYLSNDRNSFFFLSNLWDHLSFHTPPPPPLPPLVLLIRQRIEQMRSLNFFLKDFICSYGKIFSLELEDLSSNNNGRR